MSLNKRFVAGMGGLTVAAASAGMLLLGAGAANAATAPPPYEPDPAAVGTIAFYNGSGTVITSGRTDTAPFAAYAVGSATPRSGDAQAQTVFANPDPGSTPPNWYNERPGSYNPFPLTGTAPANLQAMNASHPAVIGDSGDQTLDGFESDSVRYTGTGYTNMVQVRIRTANSANQPTSTYDDADLLIDPAAHTWTQVYPAPKTTTQTTLASSANPSTVGDNITLTATESPAAAGSVQFMDGSTNLGSPVAVNGSGVATYQSSALAQGSHSLSAVFTPTDTTSYVGSTGTLTQVVNPAATKTSTSLAVNQDGTAGDDATLTATVTGPGSSPNTSGSVSFYDGSSSTPLGTVQGSAAPNGVYTLDLPNGFTAGSHSIVAKFTPTDVKQYAASQSSAQSFVTQAKQQGACADPSSQCTDTQNVQVTVPTGTLVISTPYTASSPLDLGTMSLNSTGTEYSANAPFKNIKVTDTRSGTDSYTVSALSSALSDGKTNAGSTINAQNVGLTGVTVTPGAGYNGTTTVAAGENPAAEPAVAPADNGSKGLGGNTPHAVFSEANSQGTVTAKGTLTINAPTSTEAGLFTGTITFTVG